MEWEQIKFKILFLCVQSEWASKLKNTWNALGKWRFIANISFFTTFQLSLILPHHRHSPVSVFCAGWWKTALLYDVHWHHEKCITLFMKNFTTHFAETHMHGSDVSQLLLSSKECYKHVDTISAAWRVALWYTKLPAYQHRWTFIYF
jgi:hypothetical protein